MSGLWENCFCRKESLILENFVKIYPIELGVELHAAVPTMMVGVRRPINVSKIPPATLVSALTIPLELDKDYSNEEEIPGMETQFHFLDGVVVEER